MKKGIICLLITLAVAVSVCCALSLSVDAAGWETSGNLSFMLNSDGNSYTVAAANASITTADIPDTFNGKPVTSIDGSAFKDCTGLIRVTIPNSVTNIGSRTFCNCTGLTSVTIPNSVTSIGESAFERCSRLTSVTIPDSVTSIGAYAFYDCSGLTSVTIPDSVTSIGASAFSGCSGLTSVTIPNSVINIGWSAFNRCSGLTSVAIPDSVRSIDGYAFAACSGLTSVTIPNSVTSIGKEAFYRCTGLKSVTISSINCFYYGKFGNVFSGYNNLHVTINDEVTSIGDDTFESCHGLTSVTIPNSVTSIGAGAFYNCTGLTSITIPDSVTSIGSSAFCECIGLASVTIPSSVTSIGECVFSRCTGLTSVTIPNSVTSIGAGAFNACHKLTSVTLPDDITTIYEYTFAYCSALTSITIPNSVTSIGDYTFKDCYELKTIYFNGSEEQWDTIKKGSDWDNNAGSQTSKGTYTVIFNSDGGASHECADANKDHKCDTCGKVLTECADANKDHNCDVCGKKLTGHTGGKATCKEKATCSICGQKYGNLAAHNYKTTWSSDSANHWHECSVCGSKKDEAAHTPGAAATETTAQVCTVCNYVITPALGHTHSFTKRVDERYLKSKATCTAKAVYYYSCSCGAIGNSTFEYGELAEHNAMYFWSNDRTAHWHECSTCGKKLDLSVHIPNRASATETEPVVCTVCGYLIEAAHGHIHNITGYWEKDEENHWHSCTGCDLRFDLENHVFTLVADKRNAGSSVIFGHEECVTCGLKKGSLLYGIEPGTTVEKLKKALGKDIVVNGAKNGLIGTGTKVVVGGKEYTVIIKGDIDGDGKITATDYIRVRLHILKRIRLDGEKLLAAHASTEISKNVSAADYIAIRLHILKKKLIAQ